METRPAAPAVPPTEKFLRITTTADRRGADIVDQDGNTVPGVAAIHLDLHPRLLPAAVLDVYVTADVRVAADRVQWHGLDQVPVVALRAELGRRLPATERPLLDDDRYTDLLAISYELDLGDDRDQDMASNIRQFIVADEVDAQIEQTARQAGAGGAVLYSRSDQPVADDEVHHA